MTAFGRRLGLATQLGIVLVLPIALTLGIFGFVSQRSLQRVLMTEASSELRNHSTLVEAVVVRALETGEFELLKGRLERLARADRILGIAVFKRSGEPILVTNHLNQASGALAGLATRASGAGADLEELTDLGGGAALVRTVMVESKSGASVTAVIVRDLGYVQSLSSALRGGLAMTGLALIAAAVLLVMLLTRATVGRPAQAIVAGAERIASGDLTTTVPEQGAEELARLARAFNTMTKSLAEARSRVDKEVTRRASEESGRLAAERKLQHGRALAAVGQVAASIAHEIGSPLGVILGRARLLVDQAGLDESSKRDLETISEQSERISRVVARLLEVARPPQASASGSSVARVAADVLQFLGPECRQRGIESRVECPDLPSSVALDSDQLFQVLFNLCWNAIEAQPSGGALTVRIVRASEPGRVVVEVEDAGPGVPPEIANRIFEPFFTTKADRSGSGLGLDIVSGILHEVGGSVRLSEAGTPGACFRITLPAPSSAVAAADTGAFCESLS